jgi:hypothetical protein
VTERGQDETDLEDAAMVCGICGTPHQPGDRFCAQCGAPLTTEAQEQTAAARPSVAATAPGTPTGNAPESETEEKQDPSAWVFAAPPGIVATGGVLLILLAVILLLIGQLDDTGTIVMLSFCAAPLGLIVIGIGLVRFLLGHRSEK